MKFNKLTSALMVFAVVGVAALPISSAFAAPDAAKIAERKARKSQAVGEKVGKAIAKAYELYNANQIAEAIALLEPNFKPRQISTKLFVPDSSALYMLRKIQVKLLVFWRKQSSLMC